MHGCRVEGERVHAYRFATGTCIQGYLAHKKQPAPLGPP